MHLYPTAARKEVVEQEISLILLLKEAFGPALSTDAAVDKGEK